MTTISLNGDPVTTSGDLPEVGSAAPDFVLTGGDLKYKSLEDFKGKKKLLSIVPSLDTAVCARSTKRFNELADKVDDVMMLIISADLPFAMSRFCKVEKTDNVTTLSMMRDRHFGKDYGVLMQDGPLMGITARAIVVIDADDKVIYTELVPEITQEPDYDKALAALA
ncbi:MAG: thiol peroxidase [Gammaproteobacteria bacterium]|nr:MAG: thiol peroxidase [Gammaproteobacteria bacterium]